MSDEPDPFYSVMEAKGAYNRYATIPVGGAALAIPFLEKAARQITLEDEARPIVIADYGSSQGKNSLAPMAIAIQKLRLRVPQERPILVFHIDQPANDFNSLFEVLSSDANRYSLKEANVFPCAIGRSFYEQVLPNASVHLDGARMRPCGCDVCLVSFPVISFRPLAQARSALHSNNRPKKTGQLSSHVGRLRCGPALDWLSCSQIFQRIGRAVSRR